MLTTGAGHGWAINWTDFGGPQCNSLSFRLVFFNKTPLRNKNTPKLRYSFSWTWTLFGEMIGSSDLIFCSLFLYAEHFSYLFYVGHSNWAAGWNFQFIYFQMLFVVLGNARSFSLLSAFCFLLYAGADVRWIGACWSGSCSVARATAPIIRLKPFISYCLQPHSRLTFFLLSNGPLPTQMIPRLTRYTAPVLQRSTTFPPSHSVALLIQNTDTWSV